MSRYLDRLPWNASVQFEAHLKRLGLKYLGASAMEDGLIMLARDTAELNPTDRIDVIIKSFGEADAPEAMAVIEAIQADLDLDAEVAGEPFEDTPTTRFRVVILECDGASPDQITKLAGMIGGLLGGRS